MFANINKRWILQFIVMCVVYCVLLAFNTSSSVAAGHSIKAGDTKIADSKKSPNQQTDQNSEPHQNPVDQRWYSLSENNEPQIHLYFFWSRKCPHCLDAVPFIDHLKNKHDWLIVYSKELTEHKENVDQYISMAADLGQVARSVPGFLWCGNMTVGYDSPENMGGLLERELIECYQWVKQGRSQAKPVVDDAMDNPVITVPLLGTLSLKEYSLPAYTLVLAGLDAFNPCAFFVLLFLLSLLVHAKSRRRMLIVGGVFVTFSGVMYFLFMAAWLNVFLVIGHVNVITVVAGALAVAIALVNIKDYFWYKQGLSFSIPERVKPGLYQRARGLLNTDNMPAMLTATMGLAAFANLYEFLCTAGFPMVYTRILTMEALSTSAYYFYLVLYNVIYVVPLLLIVVVFTMTLGTKKLQENQGKLLKLVSGMMMFYMGLVLVFFPNWLNNILAAFALLLVALFSSFLVNTIYKSRIGVNHGH